MNNADIKQGSPEWFALKAGKFSSSRASDLMAQGRGGAPSASRRNLLAALAVERITGVYVDSYHNGVMDRGNEVEAEARNAYSMHTLSAIDEVSFIEHPTIKNCGCSPDGLVGADGIVEFKCPSSMARHLEALTSQAHAKEHRWQAQFHMLATGRAWCDVVSYDPRYPHGLRLAIARVERDAAAIKELVGAIAVAEREVEAIIAELKTLQEKATS